MLTRIITAVVGILAVIGLVWAGGLVFGAAVLAVAVLAWMEYARMMQRFGRLYTAPALLAILAMLAAASFSSLPLFLAAILGSFTLLLFLIMGVGQSKMAALFHTVLGAMYFGMGFGALLFLRGGDVLLPRGAVSIEGGVFLLWFALLGTWASDSFAYLGGKSFGKHKMAPHISPNKTVEGLAAGMAGCILLCLGYSFYFGYSLLHALPLACMVAIAAPVGDLFESYVKRVCDVKDSSHLLPGHGGMMDRFDSLLFVAPLMVAVLAAARAFS